MKIFDLVAYREQLKLFQNDRFLGQGHRQSNGNDGSLACTHHAASEGRGRVLYGQGGRWSGIPR